MDEAAMVGKPAGGGFMRFGDVIEALATISLDMRLAYWGYPHPGSVGDNPLVVVVEGREFVVSKVHFEGSRILVDTEPLGIDPRRDRGGESSPQSTTSESTGPGA